MAPAKRFASLSLEDDGYKIRLTDQPVQRTRRLKNAKGIDFQPLPRAMEPQDAARWLEQQPKCQTPEWRVAIDRILSRRAGASHRTLPHVNAPLPDEIDDAAATHIEGAKKSITVNAYERNPDAHAACIAHHGATCAICNFDFGLAYGDEARGYIHVHHLRPLASIRETYQVDPINDLRPLCPNCHAVVHLGGTTRDIETVRSMLKKSGRPPPSA
ncbi:MAG: HNH endonuclease [Gemmatimonadetes bacterium]|nr:HNH endonuclease [Gemmatimonadota bacterium]